MKKFAKLFTLFLFLAACGRLGDNPGETSSQSLKSSSSGHLSLVYMTMPNGALYDLVLAQIDLVNKKIVNKIKLHFSLRALGECGSPQLSNQLPSGGRLVTYCETTYFDFDANQEYYINYLGNTKTYSNQVFSSGLGQVGGMAISPDGRLISYIKNVAGEWTLSIQKVGEAGPFKVIVGKAFLPSFSPDSELLAFSDQKKNLVIYDIIRDKIYKMGIMADTVYRWSPQVKSDMFFSKLYKIAYTGHYNYGRTDAIAIYTLDIYHRFRMIKQISGSALLNPIRRDTYELVDGGIYSGTAIKIKNYTRFPNWINDNQIFYLDDSGQFKIMNEDGSDVGLVLDTDDIGSVPFVAGD